MSNDRKPRNQAIKPRISKDQVLTTALLSVADRLKLSPKDLHAIIGCSESTISRLKNGTSILLINTKEAELAILLIRIYRSLDPLLGNDENSIKWLNSFNKHLGEVPSNLLKKIEGLNTVLQYLDAMRGLA